MKRPTVLFSTPEIHHPTRAGPELRVESSIKALAQVSNLHLVSRKPIASLGGEAAVAFYRRYAEQVLFVPSCTHDTEQKVSLDDAEYIVATANEIGADVIWLGYGNISYPILKRIKQLSSYPVVIDTDSVWSRFVKRGIPYAANEEKRRAIQLEGNLKEEEESWGTAMADVTTAVSEVDAEYYRSLAKDARQIHLFPNVIDPIVYRQVPPEAGFKKPCIYLSGWFGFGSPMEDAATWMLKEIWPLIKPEMPEVVFYIVGRDSEKVLRDIEDPSVIVVGGVPSVLPYLTNVDVAIVPLRFESGTRYKILEAGICGIPVVSTSLGAEGIPVVSDTHILLADSPQAFASGVIRLLNDSALSAKLSDNLKQLVNENFTINALANCAESILSYLLQD